MKEYKWQVGVDEVGRGPLAGAVYVCSLCVASEDLEHLVQSSGLPLRDSKKLSEKIREKWFVYLEQKRKEGMLDYKVSALSAGEIDKRGISVCIKACVGDSLKRLVKVDERPNTLVLLDGGLSAPPAYAQTTIIKGDENESVISLASIVAKVLRDRYMHDLHREFPHYGFDAHKGYGTKTHMENLRKFGISPIHRVSFLKNL